MSPQIFTIQAGITPAGIAITRNSKYAYIANNNNYGVLNQDSVSVIDLHTKKVVKVIYDKSFNQPYTITIDKCGFYAYVTNSNASTITIININTNSVSGVINGLDGPSGMVIKNDNLTAYVSNYGGPGGVGSGNGRTINVLNLSTKKIINTIEVDLAPAGLELSKNNRKLYCYNYVDGNPGTGTINIIDTHTNCITNTIKGLSGPFDLKISPTNNFAYVTNFGSNNYTPIGTTISVVDLIQNKIINNIKVGIQPSGVVFSKDGLLAFVTNYNTLYINNINFTGQIQGDGIINIINTKNHRVLGKTIVVGQSPANIDITPNGKNLVVTNFSSNSINLIKVKDILHKLSDTVKPAF